LIGFKKSAAKKINSVDKSSSGVSRQQQEKPDRRYYSMWHLSIFSQLFA